MAAKLPVVTSKQNQQLLTEKQLILLIKNELNTVCVYFYFKEMLQICNTIQIHDSF